jgi:hypothetical protein
MYRKKLKTRGVILNEQGLCTAVLLLSETSSVGFGQYFSFLEYYQDVRVRCLVMQSVPERFLFCSLRVFVLRFN